jgi:ribosomal protein S18 acetylase RimI-like enzyme
MPLLIREYQERDAAALHECIIALQEYERALDPRLRPGLEMVEAYWEHLLARCREAQGHVFVAEVDGSVVGFVGVLTREAFTQLDEPPGTYALISDLAVLAEYRRRGIGRQLLERAEACARATGATHLRIGVMAANSAARDLYLAVQFEPYLEILEKGLG